jgi:hypothetical protein
MNSWHTIYVQKKGDALWIVKTTENLARKISRRMVVNLKDNTQKVALIQLCKSQELMKVALRLKRKASNRENQPILWLIFLII